MPLHLRCHVSPSPIRASTAMLVMIGSKGATPAGSMTCTHSRYVCVCIPGNGPTQSAPDMEPFAPNRIPYWRHLNLQYDFGTIKWQKECRWASQPNT